MKRHLFTIILLLFPCLSLMAERKVSTYSIAFYNVENLFDTIHAEGKNDYEFLPGGSYKWDSNKYINKLKNLAQVFSELGVTPQTPKGPALIGVAEVENRAVLEDLVKEPAIRNRRLRILHFESPDRRGVDCALLYNPKQFKLQDSLYIPYIFPSADAPDDTLGFTQGSDNRIVARQLFGDTVSITRGFLVGIGEMAKERLAVIVMHWPSRGSKTESRERAGRQVMALKKALTRQYPGIKLIVMGDFNDNPDDKSMMAGGLDAKHKPQQVKKADDLYNPWWYILRKEKRGTLYFKKNWDLFDQILVSGNLIDNTMDEKPSHNAQDLHLTNGLTFCASEIFKTDYLFQQEGNYKGYLKRTSAGGNWLNGYSDHLPTYILLVKAR